MNRVRKITAGLVMTLLVFAMWSSVGQSQDEQVRKALSARPPASKEPTVPAAQAKQPGMKAEEKLVRDVYARAMRYQTAAVDELSAKTGKEAQPEDYLIFELRNIHTGTIQEIYNQQLAEIVTPKAGNLVSLKPNRMRKGNDPPHSYYSAEWNVAVPNQLPATQARTVTVAQMLAQLGDRSASITGYTSYDVTVRLKGKQRTYQALAFHHQTNGTPGQPRTEILDNIAADLNTVLADESPKMRSPWDKYSKSTMYLAVVRSITETKNAGLPLIPSDAPIGYLPGDNAAPNETDQQILAAEACQQPPTVASLQATLASTENAVSHVAPADGTFSTTNNSTAFATTSSSDLMAVFMSSETVTVTAMGVSPSTIANQLKWKMDRDPTDQIDYGLPDIIGTGPQVAFQPTLAGNFNLTCYYDTNGNNSYDSGEELRVLRWASVRTQFVSDSSFLHTQTMFTGLADGVDTANAMDLRADVILEGGGANALIGVDRVTLGNVGNLWQPDNFVVNYPVPNPAPPAPGNVAGTESENPSGTGHTPPGGTVPMVDTSRVTVNNQPTGGDTAFRLHSVNPSLGAGPGNLGQIRRVNSDDAPGFRWDYNHPTTQNPWATTVNGNAFREFIVGFSTSFPRNYVVIAFGEYSVTANGNNASGTWVSGSGAVVSGTGLTSRVSVNFTPQAGNASGVQILGLSFVRQVGMDHAP